LAAIQRSENPGQPLINVDHSAVALLKLPELRDGLCWVAGDLSFPTSKLKDVFPELNRVCARFERFLKTQPVVFDNTKGDDTSGFSRQICSAGILHRIVAFPEAYALLKRGAFMVDCLVSPKSYADFRYRLKSSGYDSLQ
jgi:hypothetical protein